MDGVEPRGALALHALHAIEDEQERDEGGHDLHLRGRQLPGREQQGRVEGAERGQRAGHHLQHDERHEQVEAGARGSSRPSARAAARTVATKPSGRAVIGWDDAAAHLRRCRAGHRRHREDARHLVGCHAVRGAGRAREAPAPPPRDEQPDGGPGEPVGDHQPVEGDVLRVVELRATVDLEPGLAEPADPGGIGEHQHPVHRLRQPSRGPVPQEEPAEEVEGDREGEDQDAAARGGAHAEGEPGEEDDVRDGEDERRPEVVGEGERPARVQHVVVGDDPEEEDHPEHHDAQGGDEGRRDAQELPPGVLARPERRAPAAPPARGPRCRGSPRGRTPPRRRR